MTLKVRTYHLRVERLSLLMCAKWAKATGVRNACRASLRTRVCLNPSLLFRGHRCELVRSLQPISALSECASICGWVQERSHGHFQRPLHRVASLADYEPSELDIHSENAVVTSHIACYVVRGLRAVSKVSSVFLSIVRKFPARARLAWQRRTMERSTEK